MIRSFPEELNQSLGLEAELACGRSELGRTTWLATMSVLLGCGAAPSAPIPTGCDVAAATGPWTISYLGAPGGLLVASPRDISQDLVVGVGRFPDGATAGFIWDQDGPVTRLPPAAGDDVTEGLRVNRRGTVLGNSTNGAGGPSTGAVIWRSGGTPESPPTPGFAPVDLTDDDLVAGMVQFGNTGRHFALWRPGSPVRDLGGPNDELSQLTAINDLAVAVGFAAQNGANEEGYLWSEASGFERIGKPAGTAWAHPEVINNCGVVAGVAFDPQARLVRPWRWRRSEGFRLLPVPPGAGDAAVTGIDSSGVVFGNVGIGDPVRGFQYHPFVWPAVGYVQLPEQGVRPFLWAADRCGSAVAEATPINVGGLEVTPLLVWKAPC